MKECLKCGNKYDPLAYVCPKCGAPESIMAASGSDALRALDSFKSQMEAAKYVDAGAGHFQRGDYEAAHADCLKAIEINPHNAVAHNNVGIVLCYLGRPLQAIPYLEKALQLDPNVEGARDYLARARQAITGHQGTASIPTEPGHGLPATGDAELDYLVKELIDIGHSGDYLSSHASDTFVKVEHRPSLFVHRRARQIGERLNEIGGIRLMQIAFSKARPFIGGKLRELEYTWDYIGEWRA